MRWGRWERWRLPVEAGAAPEGALSQRARTKPRFRREFGAGGRFSYAIPSRTPASASFRRRRALLVRNSVGSPRSGAVFSPKGAFQGRNSVGSPRSGENSTPEGASRTEFRREPSFRRRFLAGGRVIAAAAYKNLLPASQPRRRARPCGNVQRSEPPCVTREQGPRNRYELRLANVSVSPARSHSSP